MAGSGVAVPERLNEDLAVVMERHLMTNSLDLLPLDALVRTSNIDHAEWNYRGLLGWIQRLRFRQIVTMMAGRRFPRVLEIGYGSGVFMPELRRHCDELYGLDPHEKPKEVQEILARHGVKAKLFRGSATRMPFQSEFFDCLVSVSALEYVGELESACQEMARVLRRDGTLVMVTPCYSFLLEAGLRALTGTGAREYLAGRWQELNRCLEKGFLVEKRVDVPTPGFGLTRLYVAQELRPRRALE
jgi:SAM-dependent methyltransferase